jgi:CheY-like chemotaxis protein
MKLLLVDDEPSVLQFLKFTLQSIVEDIVAVECSRDAVNYLEEERFDGVLLDVHMPDLDGFELTRRVRASALNARSPVALLTGYDDARTMVEGFKAGASCFLGKPVTREKIQGLVNFMRGPIMFERRRSARLPFRCKVDCFMGPLREKRFVAESVNIGEGGMMMEPSGGLQVGQGVFLEFDIPTSEKTLRMRAKVLRHENPDRVAVQFEDGSIRDREAIQEFIIRKLQE